ncbi:hypothetical protein [Siccibacter colletis]|uniref:hypothetical protein n=1 Tax=Siccibacter colletis TaxID=1505757 RepID=UPI003CE771A4
MFNGLSAFPLTPLVNGNVDEKAFTALIETLVAAKVDAIGALGSICISVACPAGAGGATGNRRGGRCAGGGQYRGGQY